mgnify:CR=1 FL=1
MANSKSTKNVPEALNKFKYEVANEVGVSLKDAHTAVVEAETSAHSGGKATGSFK